jgi:predicted AAA+ superfamily ATPase
MILKDVLREIVRDQRKSLAAFELGTERELLSSIDLSLPFAVILSGIRRCGKSTLLCQLLSGFDRFYYFNFEDPRATGFETSDFEKLDQVFSEEFGESGRYFFDEIQNVEKWETIVRSLLDRKKHVVITGSNASLLSKELGTRLTGRHLRFELFPFSYAEFLAFKNQKPGLASFDQYLENGGFPEYLKSGNALILQELLNDLLARDIVVRHKIRSTKILREFAVYLLSNIGKEFSYNSLKKTFNFGSVNSTIAFVSYLEDSYLLFTVPRFDYSLKKQLVNPKKIYSIDNGLALVNTVSFSGNKGRMLENLVYACLRKQHSDIFYYKGLRECDFLVREKQKITLAIQVCFELNADNQQREISGLLEAMQKFGLETGFLLTHHQEDKITQNGKKIRLMPVWKWMSGKKTLPRRKNLGKTK